MTENGEPAKMQLALKKRSVTDLMTTATVKSTMASKTVKAVNLQVNVTYALEKVAPNKLAWAFVNQGFVSVSQTESGEAVKDTSIQKTKKRVMASTITAMDKLMRASQTATVANLLAHNKIASQEPPHSKASESARQVHRSVRQTAHGAPVKVPLTPSQPKNVTDLTTTATAKSMTASQTAMDANPLAFDKLALMAHPPNKT